MCICVCMGACTHAGESVLERQMQGLAGTQVWGWAKASLCNVSFKDSSVSGTTAPSSLVLALLASHSTLVVIDTFS